MVGVQRDRAGGLSQCRPGPSVCGQLGELAGLGDLDRVGSGVEAGEGVVAVRVGLGGGDALPSAPTRRSNRDVFRFLTVVKLGGLSSRRSTPFGETVLER